MELGSAHILQGYYRWTDRSVTLAAQTGQAAPANPDRIGLIFSGPVGTSTAIWPFPLKTINGILVAQSGLPVWIRFRDFPGMLNGPWYWFTNSVGTVLAVLELQEVQPPPEVTIVEAQP